MIRRDFETGGFPINKRCPVFCITDTGDTFIAYNRFTLVTTLKNKPIKKCIGIWPGKINTDCFPMQPDCYINTLLPPMEHQSIDDSDDIKIYYQKGLVFDHLSYMEDKSDGSRVMVVSKEEALKTYVTTVGLKYVTITED